MANNNSFVGSKIKGLRETKNLSIEEIAERSGLTVEQINSIENDVNLPSLGPLIKIARALGVRLGTFMDDNDALGPVVTRAKDREKDSSISFSNGATDARKHMEYHPLAQLVATWSRSSSTSIPRRIPISSSQPTRVRSSST